MSAAAVMPDQAAVEATRSAGSAAAAASVVAKGDEPSAADRLGESRARLRLALLEIAHPAPKASLFDDLPALGNLKAKLQLWLTTLPGAALVLDSLDSWWRQHPMRTVGIVAKEAGEQILMPVARRNPYAFVFGAAALGALLVLAKPWRWLLRPALFIGLVPQIASHALRRMPIDTWVQMAVSLVAKKPVTRPPNRTDGPGPL